MDGRAHLRTENGWLNFDQLIMRLAGLGVLLLALLAHKGYGPWSYKACFDKAVVTKQADLKVEPRIVAAPAPLAAVEEPKMAPPPAVLPAVIPLVSSIQAERSGKQITLSGIVPSANAKNELVSDTNRLLVDGVVIDRLVVDSGAKAAPWLDNGRDIANLLLSIREASAVSILGETVRLSGTVTGSTDKEVAGLKAVEIFGPDSKLYNMIDVKPLKDSIVEIESRGEAAVVAGRVGTEEIYNTVMQSARSVFGDNNVIDRLAVDESTSALSWQQASLPVVTSMSDLKYPSSVRIEGNVVQLTGLADSENEKSARGLTMSKLLGTAFKIDNQISVRELLASVVDFQNTDGKLTISGQVGDEVVKKALVEAAQLKFGASNITDRLTVMDTTAPISWSDKIGLITEQVLNLKQPGGIRASGSTITLTGLVDTIGERELRATEAQVLFGADATIDNQIRLVEQRPIPVDPPTPEPVVVQAPPPVPVVDCKRIAEGTVVEFALNKADLTESGKGALDQIMACIKDGRYQVAGHTDSTGNAAWNTELSLLRAKAAVDHLIGKGADGARLQAQGFGSAKPIKSNATREGRAQNRRISFTPVP
jgi:OmpA-OmpF porin, OOP family